SLHAVDPVVLRECFIEKGMIRIEEITNRAVVLEEVSEEANRFLLQSAAHRSESGKEPLALLIELFEVRNVQPVSGEARGKTADLCILKHAPRLGDENFRFVKMIRSRDLC